MYLVFSVSKRIDPQGLAGQIQSVRPGLAAAYYEDQGLVSVTGAEPGDQAAIQAAIDQHDAAAIPKNAYQISSEKRAQASARAVEAIERSPVARAILEGGDLSEYATDEVVSTVVHISRLLFAASGLAWPDWTRETRQ
jgi:uncharacterized protein YgbK (DUF1537 family)